MIHYCLSIQSSSLKHFLEEKSLGIHVKGIHIDNSTSHHLIFFLTSVQLPGGNYLKKGHIVQIVNYLSPVSVIFCTPFQNCKYIFVREKCPEGNWAIANRNPQSLRKMNCNTRVASEGLALPVRLTGTFYTLQLQS